MSIKGKITNQLVLHWILRPNHGPALAFLQERAVWTIQLQDLSLSIDNGERRGGESSKGAVVDGFDGDGRQDHESVGRQRQRGG